MTNHQTVTLGKTAEVEDGRGKCFVTPDGSKIAVFNVGGKFYAIDDLCTHAEASLSDGWVDGHCVACPWHGAEFDLKTGAAMTPPASEPVKNYPVVVDGEDLKIEMPGG